MGKKKKIKISRKLVYAAERERDAVIIAADHVAAGERACAVPEARKRPGRDSSRERVKLKSRENVASRRCCIEANALLQIQKLKAGREIFVTLPTFKTEIKPFNIVD